MRYYTAAVKGNKFQAARAAADRGIPFAFQHETSHGETVGRIPVDYLPALCAWLCEPGVAPYPIGTLLIYSEHNAMIPQG